MERLIPHFAWSRSTTYSSSNRLVILASRCFNSAAAEPRNWNNYDQAQLALMLSAPLLLAIQCVADAADVGCSRDDLMPSLEKCGSSSGWSVVSVKGRSLCARGSICSSSNPSGNCPGPQDGLNFGSTCTQDGSTFSCAIRSTCSSHKPDSKCGVTSNAEKPIAPGRKDVRCNIS